VNEPPLIVVDLDGTVCLGDAPVLAFASRAFAHLEPTTRARAHAALEAFLAGDATAVPGARDGYQAGARIASALGVGPEAREAAFAASRTAIDEWLGEIRAPERLVDALRAAAARRVLVTNSPAPAVARVLAALGIRDVFHDVVPSAGKPERMAEALDALGVSRRVDPHALATIGDIWANDHAEAHARGASTFLIDTADFGDGEPTARARTPDELAPAVAAWATVSTW